MSKKRTESTVSRLTKNDDTGVILRLLAESQKVANVGSWSFDLRTKELLCSDELYRLFGLTPGKSHPSYRSLLNRVHPEDMDQVNKILADAFEGARPFSFDHKILLPDGTERVLHEQSEVTYEQGKATRMIGIVRDITLQKTAEEELKKSGEQIRAIIDHSTAVIYLKDLRGRYLLINRRFEELFHLKKEEVIGKTAHEVFPDELARQFRLNDLRVIESGKPLEFEETAPQDDGIHTFISVKFPMFDSQGMIYAVGGVSTDITHLKFVHETLLQQAYQLRQYASIVESSNEAIIGKSLDGKIMSWNPAAERIYGYSAEEVIGKSISILIPPEKQKESAEIVERIKREQIIDRYETTRVRKDGTIVHVSIAVSPIKTSVGKIIGYSTISQDITERKILEEAEKKDLQLQEIQHRFKNHLQVISSMLRLQSSYLEDEKAREFFRESIGRIKSMSLLHEKLYQSAEPSNVSISEYLQKVTAELFQSYGIDPNRIELKLETDDIVLPVEIALPCGFIINELVSNSLKYAFPAGIKGEIAVQLRRQQNACILCVRDNGIGLPDGLNLEQTTTLGLKLVRSLTKQINGKLEIERNGGTTFKIFLNEPAPAPPPGSLEQPSPQGWSH
jgi:PAS domain S-box-containing protein